MNFFDAPHSLFDNNQQFSVQNLPDDIKLTAIIQKSLRDKKIETSDVNLSLPTRDIILRSFIIPWMTPSEIKSVVEFEARRYIPFELKELIYGYHATTITEERVRQIRILFIAAHKNVIKKYCSVLEQSDLNVGAIEPAAISILRTLTLKKHIKRQQNFALIQASKNEGSIVIVYNGIPQFVRDFRLLASSSPAQDAETQTLSAKLLNEIRISLDYYRRQRAPGKIDKIILVSSGKASDIAKNIEADLGIKTTSLTTRMILGLPEEVDTGVLNAFGCGVRGNVSFPVDIDLNKPREKAPETKKVFVQTPTNYATTAKVAIVCAGIILFTFITFSRQVAQRETTLQAFKDKIGMYEALEISDINKKQAEATQKLDQYKQIRLTSNVAFLLDRIPELLPDGAWLTNLNISYPDSMSRRRTQRQSVAPTESEISPSVDMDGYVYSEDADRQLERVNEFIMNLKEDGEFSEIFNDIILAAASKETLGEHTVTRFQINCR